MTRRALFHFTILEVVVSLAILSLSIAGFLALTSRAQQRIGKSYDEWRNMHMLAQAAEYFMLMPEDTGTIDEKIFPYTNHTVKIEYDEADNIPDDFATLDFDIPLKKMTLRLYRNSDNEKLDELIIDRISYENSISEN